MMASALYIAVRVTFMEFILLTPFCALFFKLMGAKLGKNVQINSTRVGDISILEIGDNSVIGGNATVISPFLRKKGLHIEKVRIGKNVIIGLNSIILPGLRSATTRSSRRQPWSPKTPRSSQTRCITGLRNNK